MTSRILVFLALALFAAPLPAANILSVERRNLRAGETLIITVSLEHEFASIDDVRLPLRNLTLIGTPSISSEFSWINGTVVRRKVFRFRARSGEAGPAMVGVVMLATADGQRDTLPAIAIQVLPDRAATSNDPEVVLRELLASGRDPFFIVPEYDQSAAYVGEQVVVTWWLYNALTIQQWQIGALPRLSDFWVEEIDVRSVPATTVAVGEYAMQKVPIRRVALFPLRSGKLDVGPMEVEAAVLRRRSGGPFSIFEGSLVEISFDSAHVALDSRPIPAGAPVSTVGDFSMRCSTPLQRNGGPVVVDATVAGRGNLRSAEAPAFVSAPEGDVQLVQSAVTVQKSRDNAAMTRRWQFLIFPRRSGLMTIPPLQLTAFSPARGARQTLRCEATTLAVSAQSKGVAPAAAPAVASRRRWWPIAAAVTIAIVALALILPWLRRRQRINREIHEVTSSGEPARIRADLHAQMERSGLDPSRLLKESSDRGDAYRSVRSLLDALERDRIDVGDVQREIRRRVRDLLAT